MNHEQASVQMAVEKYLLDELAPPDRDEFEQHFFGCLTCAAELKTTAAFLGVAKDQLTDRLPPGKVVRPTRLPERKSWFDFIWRPAVLSPAFAVLLLVVGYQNLVLDPQMHRELTQLRSPEIVPSVALVNSRAGGTPALTLSATQSFVLPVDIPTVDSYTGYSCELVAPSGAVVWRLPVSPEQARNTVSIKVAPATWERGTYSLIVKGYSGPNDAPGAEITRYRFVLNSPG